MSFQQALHIQPCGTSAGQGIIRSLLPRPGPGRETSRITRPHSALQILLCLFTFIPFCLDSAHANADTSATSSLQAASQGIGTSPKAVFAFVRDNIAPELNRRPLQSPAQVLVSGRGNSRERSRLLAHLLGAAGHPVRFQSGDLDVAKTADLINAALPPASGERAWLADVPISRPAEDPVMIEAVRRHTWVQVLIDGQWLDLDPSFPGQPGDRHAEPTETFYRFSESRLPRLELTVELDRTEAPGKFEELAWWDGPLETLAGQALSVRILPIIASADGDDHDLDPALRLVNPLTGADEENPQPLTVTTWRAELALDEEVLHVGEAPDIGPSETGTILSLRLKSRIVFAAEDVIEDVRILSRNDDAGRLPLFQRHALYFGTSAVSQEEFDRWVSSHSPAERDSARREIEGVKRDLTAGQNSSSELLSSSLQAEQVLGHYGGHLLNLAYCFVSDLMSADLGRRLGVHSFFDQPRLVVTSFLTGADGTQQVIMDLRRDRQEAVARPGTPRRMTETQQFGRGVMASALEGRLMALASGAPALTTAALMRQAQSEGIPTRLLSKRETGQLNDLDLPDTARALLEAALADGQVVIVPARPILFRNRERWGWWQIDPVSGHTIGVLDSGLHQAMMERTLIETEGVLSDEMATVIGAISGATDTQFIISAMVLEHGELSAEALNEAKAFMSELGENLCQELTVEAKIEAKKTIASASVEMEGCFKYEESVEIGGKAGGSLTLMDTNWCEAFQRGFTCSSMTILNAYLSDTKE
jgi:hypothetical protein